MAVDVCSSSEPFISPRISFSHDLNNQQSSETAATIDSAITTTFDFCFSANLKLAPATSADELFLNGVLLPTQIKVPKAAAYENEVMGVHRKRLKELLSENDDKQEKSSSTQSFWKFTRTTSLNSSNETGPKSLFRSLSLKRLLRSNSTLNTRGRENAKQVITMSNSLKELEPLGFNGNESRRTLAKKDSVSGYQVNSVLNNPSAYKMNLFGYGPFFCKGKTKDKNQ